MGLKLQLLDEEQQVLINSHNTRPKDHISITNSQSEQYYFRLREKRSCFRVFVLSVGLIGILVVFFFASLVINHLIHFHCKENIVFDDQDCVLTLAESIPENLTFVSDAPVHLSTYEAWKKLINEANHSLDIISFYWLLREDGNISHSSNWQGLSILDELFNLMKRGVKLRIIQNLPNKIYPDLDTVALAEAGAEILSMNMSKFYNSGLLHTKLWLVDGNSFYIGSANMDWRSLTQVKEIGVLGTSCPSLAHDVSKIVEVYVYLATHHRMPYVWPCKYRTRFNKEHPMVFEFNKTLTEVYFSSSPREFCPPGRTFDLDAILDVIYKAKRFVYISVMDYGPVSFFTKPQRFWTAIDDALRKVALEKGVEVRFMGSLWTQTKPSLIPFLKSLAALNGSTMNHKKTMIDAKMFCVPYITPEQMSIPYARVNHDKFMVTDEVAYIGTSNWLGDYFIDTAGVGLVLNQSHGPTDKSSLHQQLLDVFLRDWNSNYTRSIWDVHYINYSNPCSSSQ